MWGISMSEWYSEARFDAENSGMEGRILTDILEILAKRWGRW